MSEIPVVLGPGGGRDATGATSSTAVFLDLSAFVGKYVEISADQAAFFKFVPAAGSYTFSTSGTVAMSASPAAGSALVGKRVAANTTFHRLVSPKWPRLMYQAQSTSITYVEVNAASDGSGV